MMQAAQHDSAALRSSSHSAVMQAVQHYSAALRSSSHSAVMRENAGNNARN